MAGAVFIMDLVTSALLAAFIMATAGPASAVPGTTPAIHSGRQQSLVQADKPGIDQSYILLAKDKGVSDRLRNQPHPPQPEALPPTGSGDQRNKDMDRVRNPLQFPPGKPPSGG